jgi:hypothetical protein
MKHLVVIALAFVCQTAHTAIIEMDKEERQLFAALAQKRYAETALNLFSTNVPFASIYANPLPRLDISHTSDMDVASIHAFCALSEHLGYVQKAPGRKRGVWVPVSNTFSMGFDYRTKRLTRIRNGMLHEYTKTNCVQSTPELAVGEAVFRAKGYLEFLGIGIPAHMSLAGANFNATYDTTNCWSIIWLPRVNGYQFDALFCRQIIHVQFHERFGLIEAGIQDYWPLPKSTEIHFSCEAAILKAEKAAPLVMETPFYRQCRLPGFKVEQLKNAQLLISAPNWLLDPERAIWFFDKPPDETRLCWVVVFETVDTVRERPRNFKPMPPDIRIYIDAATGEIVGANFT